MAASHLLPRCYHCAREHPRKDGVVLAGDCLEIPDLVLCKACGTCVAGCPSGAVRALHFSDDQVYAEIEGILV
jgi:heterodisulfide reductase subunit A-like polyferredoxin